MYHRHLKLRTESRQSQVKVKDVSYRYIPLGHSPPSVYVSVEDDNMRHRSASAVVHLLVPHVCVGLPLVTKLTVNSFPNPLNMLVMAFNIIKASTEITSEQICRRGAT